MVSIGLFSCILAGLVLIHGYTGVPIVQKKDTDQSAVPRRQRSITYEEVRRLMAKTPFAPSQMMESTIGPTHQRKRNITAATMNYIDAVQSIISDHQKMIHDQQRMISNLINNTVNITQFNQYYAEEYSKATPHWRSWRDVSLLLLLAICGCVLVFLIASRLRPLDMLTSLLLRYQQQMQQAQEEVANKQIKLPSNPKEKTSTVSQPPVAPMTTIQRDYFNYAHTPDSY